MSLFLFLFCFLDYMHKWNHLTFAFSGWLILRSTMPSRSNHVVADDKISFLFMTELYSIVYMHHFFFNHSTIDGHLGSFYILATVNNAAITIWMHVSFQFSVLDFCGLIPRSEIAGSFFSLIIAFVSKSVLSDISIATQVFLLLLLPFSSLCFQSLCVFWSEVSLLETPYGRACFVIHSITTCLLIGAFNPFAFKVIIYRCVFIAILLFIFVSVFSFFFLKKLI